jgi:hypothetical protein
MSNPKIGRAPSRLYPRTASIESGAILSPKMDKQKETYSVGSTPPPLRARGPIKDRFAMTQESSLVRVSRFGLVSLLKDPPGFRNL